MSDMKVDLEAIVSAQCSPRTVGDLRKLIEWCDKHQVKDSALLDWGSGNVYVELTGAGSVPAEWIECGDHIPPKVMFDVLVPTHEHKYNGPENYEEALEMAESRSYKTETFRMYQDRLDRYGDDRRPE